MINQRGGCGRSTPPRGLRAAESVARIHDQEGEEEGGGRKRGWFDEDRMRGHGHFIYGFWELLLASAMVTADRLVTTGGWSSN